MTRRATTGGKATKARRRKAASPKRPTAPAAARRVHSADADLQEQVKALTRELTEAREQQTATSVVLQVINSSPGDLAPVFDAILEKAHTLCGATIGALEIWDGDNIRAFATRGLPGPFDELIRQGYRPGPDDPHWQLVDGARFVHVPDQASVVEPTHQKAVELAGIRTFLAVALRKENLLGRIVAARKEVLPFSDKEIALLQHFAAQAVIAIENTRLLNELRESLQQQTATADVLRVINRSTFDLQVVLDTLVESAARLCRAERTAIRIARGGLYHHVSNYGFSPEVSERMRHEPVEPSGFTMVGRVLAEGKAVHIVDAQADPDERMAEMARVSRTRSLLGAPLMREGSPIGVLLLQRSEIEPFSNQQIALATTFADQASIAIENVRLFEAEQARTRELSEALEQQTATSEVLKVISSAPGELEPVFSTVLESATRICEAEFGTLFRYDGEFFHRVAAVGTPPALVEFQRQRGPFEPEDDSTILGRVLRSKSVAHSIDGREEPYPDPPVKYGGARSMVGVPMLKDDQLIGAIVVYRQEVRAFTDKQIELVQNFAAQAVIAIENARLLNELRARTDDLTESLEQQTATSEVLKVISSSPGELEPVFQAMLANATRICEAKFGVMHRYDGAKFYLEAMLNAPPAYAELQRQRGAFLPEPGNALDRMLRTRAVVHVVDDNTEPVRSPAGLLGGARSLIAVPMTKENELVGAIFIYRQEVRPFTERQIELVKNFAAQAVIAIENTRLLNELRQRTNDLTESLEQQTATSDVLKVISSSPGELQPVFDAMLKNASRLCGASMANLILYDGHEFRAAALHGATPALRDLRQRDPVIPLGPKHPFHRMVATKALLHIPDFREDDTYIDREQAAVDFVDKSGVRSFLAVPMLKEDRLIGLFGIYRREVRSFTNKQIELVQNFANQAVIAIENARLLNELRQSLQQQTATADVLKVISRSTFDLQTVLDTLVESAARLCRADRTAIRIARDGLYHHLSDYGFMPDEARERMRRSPVEPTRGSMVGRVVLEGKAVHLVDAQADSEEEMVRLAKLSRTRTLLGVPLMREGVPTGVLLLQRSAFEPFTDKQIELATTFADQAVIAIENTRLLNELRQRTDDLSEALEQQTATSEVLKVISSSPGELGPVFQAMLENATRICDAKFGTLFLYNGERFQRVASTGTPSALVEFQTQRGAFEPGGSRRFNRMLRTKAVDQTIDELAELNPGPGAKYGGARSVVEVPMLKNNEVVGAVIIYRQEVRPFTDKQIALVQNFAAQAVIAIENTRLLSELRQSLEQQTATADVLKTISRSAFDLQTVLDTLIESAARLCHADKTAIRMLKDGYFHNVASYGYTIEQIEWLKNHPYSPDRSSVVGRVMLDGELLHVSDAQDSAQSGLSDRAGTLGVRTMLGVPLLREGAPIGALILMRNVVQPFTEQQIALVTTFADQAVIAIENVRLFDEVQKRTDDLSDALEQQTATSDVLKAISTSPGDLTPVFQAILKNAAHICGAKFGVLWQTEGQGFRSVAIHGPTVYTDAREREPVIHPGPEVPLARIALSKQVLQVPDLRQDESYLKGFPPIVNLVDNGGARTLMMVPMLKESELMGAVAIFRPEIKPFNERQVELLENFAAQAVIAIENTRLLNELRQRTDDLGKSLEDLQTAQDRLVQTQKLASLGQLTAGIAHEIKNPLNFVNNFSSLSTELLDELREALQSLPIDGKARAEIDELTDTLRSNLDKIEQHGKRADSIVKNMLLHSREGSGEHRPVDINALVEEALNLAYHGARAEKQGFNITMEKSFDPAAGEVDLFPQEITRVLLNLISNGFYAATKRKTEADGGHYEPTLAAATKSIGDSVEIRIRDNGTGIPPDVKEKMFNPFFTTKPAGEGTGLGLSLSYDIIVKQHSGSIEVDTQPGEFTEFRIVLPRGAATIAKSGGRA